MADDDYGSHALLVRINALETLLNEREDRTKERFANLEKSIILAMTAAEKAVSKAEQATEKRFEGVNEFRETLRDQAATLMPRAEYDVRHSSLLLAVTALNDRVGSIENNQRGRRDGLSIIGQIVLGVIAAMGTVAAVTVAIFHH